MAGMFIKMAYQHIDRPMNSAKIGETLLKIGIIGLGNMGSKIAKRLLSFGVDVGVFDINEKAINDLVALGAVDIKTPAELASTYPYVITLLPNANIVKEIVFGENGLIHGFTPKSLLIEMTTSIPAVTKEINKTLTSATFG